MDIQNQSTDTWIVLEKIKRDARHYCWKCKCVNCGSVKIVYSLKSSFERCQNCPQNSDIPDDLSKMSFGKWTVSWPITIKGRKKWACICECGNMSNISTHALVTDSSTMCRECSNKQKQLNGKMSYQRYFTIMNGAKIRDIEFDQSLTREYLEELYEKQSGLCALSGIPIQFAANSKTVKKGGDTASLDRIDSDKPYEIGNIMWVHKIVNIMKGRLSCEQFVKWCRQIVSYNDGVEMIQSLMK